MRVWQIALACMLALASDAAQAADIYRCKQADGRVVYQAIPCVTGEQKAIDDREARARERERKQKEEWQEQQRARKEAERLAAEQHAIERAIQEKAEEESQRRRLANLHDCKVGKEDCDFFTYRRWLVGLRSRYVEVALGSPSRIQDIGSETYYYYTIAYRHGDGIRAGRVQIVIRGAEVRAVNLY